MLLSIPVVKLTQNGRCSSLQIVRSAGSISGTTIRPSDYFRMADGIKPPGTPAADFASVDG